MCLNQQKVYCTKCKITWFYLLIDSKKYWEKKEKNTMISNINPVKSMIIKKRFAIILNSNKIVTITLPVKSFT